MACVIMDGFCFSCFFLSLRELMNFFAWDMDGGMDGWVRIWY